MAATSLAEINNVNKWRYVLRALGWRGTGKIQRPSLVSSTWKMAVGGAPADDTAATDPEAVGVLAFDVDNDDVYVCSAYTGSTTHAWTKIANIT